VDIAALEKELVAGGYYGWHLNGGLLDDTVTLSHTHEGWQVYYSERGQQHSVRTFRTEDEACRYFLAFIAGGSSF